MSRGGTFLLTGLPSAGKTTIAHGVKRHLTTRGRGVEVLDGDEMRRLLSSDLGYSPEHRKLHLDRLSVVAKLLAQNNVVVLMPVIAPYAASRQRLRVDHQQAGITFAEVFVHASLDVCMRRDVKGLYAEASRGRLAGMTGLDAPYEAPDNCELMVDTNETSELECIVRVSKLVQELTAI